MAGTPLKLKDTSDAQEMTDANIDQYIVPLILFEFASDQTTSLRGNVTVAAGSSGDFNIKDTIRVSDIGDATPHSTSTTDASFYKVSQDTSTEDVSSVTTPCRYIASGNKLQNMTSAELKDHILLRVANSWASTTYPLGSYHLGTAAPDGDTWTDIGVAMTDTFRLSGTDGSTTYKLRRKTGPATSNSALRPFKAIAAGLQLMTDTEIKSLAAEWRNFLLSSQSTNSNKTIGDYAITTTGSAPGTGTWVAAGAFVDTIADMSTVQYAGQYTGQYSGQYTGQYSGQYTGQYSRFFGGSFQAQYSGQYTGQYAGQYSGQYSGQYTGQYAGATLVSGSQSAAQTYSLFKRIG